MLQASRLLGMAGCRPCASNLLLLKLLVCIAVISLCGQRQELGKALTLVADMRGRGITPNIHTYTALINTCIRSGDHSLALDVFQTLQVRRLVSMML